MRNNVYWTVLILILLLSACAPKNISIDHTIVPKDVQETEQVQKDTNEEDKNTHDSDGKKGETNEENKHEEPASKVEETEITVTAIGDILIHGTVYTDAKTKNGYDFTPMLTLVAPYFQESTIAFANQETMIGGEELGLSTYPQFNSPVEIGDALKESGIDIVSLANNHTMDAGEEAIQRAIQHWKKIDMPYVGAYKDEKDADTLRVIETEEGIDVAFLAYTYGTNGIPIPEGKDFLVNLIDEEKIEYDIKEARSKADVTIISLHFGEEYKRMPNEEQKELVQFVADLEVDVVLGHHPHVLQPADWVEGKGGNDTLVIYSLGNFLSGQDQLYRQIGGIFGFTINKKTTDDQVETTVHSPTFVPTYNESKDKSNFKVIPFKDVEEKQLKNATEHYEEIKDHMTQWMPELEIIE